MLVWTAVFPSRTEWCINAPVRKATIGWNNVILLVQHHAIISMNADYFHLDPQEHTQWNVSQRKTRLFIHKNAFGNVFCKVADIWSEPNFMCLVLQVYISLLYAILSLHWCHNRHDSISNHQPHHCLLNRLFRRRSKKISKLCITGLCAGNSPETGEFPAQMASNAENVSIWWHHHVLSSNIS